MVARDSTQRAPDWPVLDTGPGHVSTFMSRVPRFFHEVLFAPVWDAPSHSFSCFALTVCAHTWTLVLVPAVPNAASGDNKHDFKATNISGMDVSPSGVVVCSADTAWYYHVPHASDAPQQHRREWREHMSLSQSQQRRIHPPRDESSTTAGREGRTDIVESTLESLAEAAAAGGAAAMAAAGASPEGSLLGFRLPSSCMTEARFSGDEERCFFGSMAGEVYVVGPVAARRVPSAWASFV